jgi:tetratricopeptide (TPR) repeat protein
VRNTALLVLTFALSACVSTSDGLSFKSAPANDPRYSYAMQLEQQQQWAGALVQWRILALLYTDNAQIKKQITDLNQKIELRVSALEQEIAQLGPHASASKQHYLQLKILALKPDYQPAIAYLQHADSRHELARAERKALPAKPMPKKPISAAVKVLDPLDGILATAEQQSAQGDYEQLLLSVAAIEDIAPQHPSLKHYRYTAWNGLAKHKLSQSQINEALQCYEKALRFAVDADKQSLSHTITQIRQQESDRLYGEAMKLFTSDITQSIKLLEQAVSIDAANQRAGQQLQRAHTISKNLKQIKKNQN